MRTITRIIVHHSDGPSAATVESVRAYHTAPRPRGRGWSDIGYHLVLREDEASGWLVEGGRPLAQVGAHDQGQNEGSIGVCVFGAYSATVAPPPAAWELLVGLVSGLCRRYGLSAEAVEGHREHEPVGGGTSCPGFDPERLRRAVKATLARAA